MTEHKDTRCPVKLHGDNYIKVSGMLLLPNDYEVYQIAQRKLCSENLEQHIWKMNMPPYARTIAEVRTRKE